MDFITNNKNAKIRKTIHLIRHGQTDFNRLNIIQGSGIDSELNAYGREQAQKFYAHYKNMPYKRIYTSKLIRTIQSVEPFILNGVPHTALSEFNEINWGIMEGKVSDRSNYDTYRNMIETWASGRLDTAVEGGETPTEMYNRQEEGMKSVMKAEHEDKILICMHGRALRSFLCLLTGSPLQQMEKWQHSNFCLYELEFNGNLFDIIRENDTSHL